jgi:hypothetical protein
VPVIPIESDEKLPAVSVITHELLEELYCQTVLRYVYVAPFAGDAGKFNGIENTSSFTLC